MMVSVRKGRIRRESAAPSAADSRRIRSFLRKTLEKLQFMGTSPIFLIFCAMIALGERRSDNKNQTRSESELLSSRSIVYHHTKMAKIGFVPINCNLAKSPKRFLGIAK
jgi:hypothetical protein